MSLAIQPEKPKYPRVVALDVAKELVGALKVWTRRIVVAGSMRRRWDLVGDVEILFVPRLVEVKEPRQGELMACDEPKPKLVDLAALTLNAMAHYGLLDMRKTLAGSMTWGEKNKYARHPATGIPVDFFTATEGNWFNYLVCRTGGAESNIRIASAAQAKGWKWNPYGEGFTDNEGNVVRVESEEDVFRLAGLPYLQPWERS